MFPFPPEPFLGQPRAPIPAHLRYPWERGFVGIVLGTVPSILPRPPVPLPPPPMAEPAPPPPTPPGSKPIWKSAVSDHLYSMAGRRRVPVRKPWPDQADDERARALDIWVRICDQIPPGVSKLVAQADAEEEADRYQVFVNAFSEKAPATMAKRGGSILAFLRWARASPFQAFPLDEHVVYKYVEEARVNGAAATMPQAFMEALPFMATALGIDLPADVVKSSRIRGSVCRTFDRKRLTEKASPLTKDEVISLELGAIHLPSVVDRVISGTFAYATGARQRVGDLSRICLEPMLDLDAEGHGYIEVAASELKTGRGRAKRRRGLPVVADAQGVSNSPWAASFLAARKEAGLDASVDGAFMLVPSYGDKFTQVKVATYEASILLREVLIKLGHAPGQVQRLTAHSCKATMLSWAAKFGLSPSTRRLLGAHAKVSDRSMLEYSRDALAGPLRDLRGMLEAIDNGGFDPDATRSGRFHAAGCRPKAGPQDEVGQDSAAGSDSASEVEGQDGQQLSQRDSQSPVTPPPLPGDEVGLVEAFVEIGATSVALDHALTPVEDAEVYELGGDEHAYFHMWLGSYHVAGTRLEEGGRLRCGRAGTSYCASSERLVDVATMCKDCYRAGVKRLKSL